LPRGGQGIGQPDSNIPNSSGLRMPGSSGANMGYGQSQGIGNNLTGQNNMPQQPQFQSSQPMPNLQQPNQSNNQSQPLNQVNPMPNLDQQPQMQLSNEMRALSVNPQFLQLRMQVQANPGILQAHLESIRQANPAMFQLINAHQQEFI